MNRVDFSSVKITNGFWMEKQELIRDVSTYSVYKRFKETGRIDAFKCDKNPKNEPHIFWDSDVAKWIEGVSYLISQNPNSELEKIEGIGPATRIKLLKKFSGLTAIKKATFEELCTVVPKNVAKNIYDYFNG